MIVIIIVLLAVQGTLQSLLQHQNLKASILQCSVFFMVQFSHPYVTTGKTIALTIQTGKAPSVYPLRCLCILRLYSPQAVVKRMPCGVSQAWSQTSSLVNYLNSRSILTFPRFSILLYKMRTIIITIIQLYFKDQKRDYI